MKSKELRLYGLIQAFGRFQGKSLKVLETALLLEEAELTRIEQTLSFLASTAVKMTELPENEEFKEEFTKMATAIYKDIR